MPVIKSFSINSVEYKSQKEYFFTNNHHHAETTGTAIKIVTCHTMPQYQQKFKLKNKMRHLTKQNRDVRLYTKHDFTNQGSTHLVEIFYQCST